MSCSEHCSGWILELTSPRLLIGNFARKDGARYRPTAANTNIPGWRTKLIQFRSSPVNHLSNQWNSLLNHVTGVQRACVRDGQPSGLLRAGHRPDRDQPQDPHRHPVRQRPVGRGEANIFCSLTNIFQICVSCFVYLKSVKCNSLLYQTR